MKKSIIALAMMVLAIPAIFSQNTDNMADNANQTDGVVVNLETTLGDIKVLLYNDTPLHRDNFVKLVNDGYYDGVLFHRVINHFMVQTGDPNSKDATPGKRLGEGDPGYTIEAEIDYPKHFHKYGALAAARTGDNVNPERRSSGSQFYIVTGTKQSPAQLNRMANEMVSKSRHDLFVKKLAEHKDEMLEYRNNANSDGINALRIKLMKEAEAEIPVQPLPKEISDAYSTVGGTPHLDGAYTVFGEVLSGMDVVEKIQSAATDRADRPVDDIRIIKATVVK